MNCYVLVSWSLKDLVSYVDGKKLKRAERARKFCDFQISQNLFKRTIITRILGKLSEKSSAWQYVVLLKTKSSVWSYRILRKLCEKSPELYISQIVFSEFYMIVQKIYYRKIKIRYDRIEDLHILRTGNFSESFPCPQTGFYTRTRN